MPPVIVTIAPSTTTESADIVPPLLVMLVPLTTFKVLLLTLKVVPVAPDTNPLCIVTFSPVTNAFPETWVVPPVIPMELMVFPVMELDPPDVNSLCTSNIKVALFVMLFSPLVIVTVPEFAMVVLPPVIETKDILEPVILPLPPSLI